MNAVVDTSVWIEFFRGKTIALVEAALQEGRLFVTPVIAAELISGAHSPKEEKAILTLLEDLPLVETPFPHWIEVGRLRAKCRKKGFSISTPDAHIAQASLDCAAVLYTQDAIFEKIAGLIGLKVVRVV